MSLKKHFFICTKCKTQTGIEDIGLELQQSLKKIFKEKYPNQSIRINKSGCLGKCSNGVNAVCYPMGKWYENLSISDVENLENELKDE